MLLQRQKTPKNVFYIKLGAIKIVLNGGCAVVVLCVLFFLFRPDLGCVYAPIALALCQVAPRVCVCVVCICEL